ncbi:MAG: hypothetical protein HY903_10175 [Deltaproteobacteria bacterium]|nr:hypothetical protein [Deltaproteobacteria bacterium]
MRRLRWLSLGICGVAALAHAHAVKPDRELLLQLDAGGGAELWRLQIGGEAAAATLAAANLDRQATLSPAARVAVALSLLARARKGVSLRFDEAPLAQADLKPKLDASGNALVALGLVELLLPAAGRCGPHRLEVALDARAAPLGVEVRAQDGWTVAGVELNGVAAGGAAVVLARKDRLEVRVVGACAASPAGTPPKP